MDGTNDMEAMMAHLGDFGKYQAWQFTLHVLSAVTAGMHMLSLVTVAAVPEHRCAIPNVEENKVMNNSISNWELSTFIPRTASGGFDSCSLFNGTNDTSMKCDSWVYDRTYYQSSRAIEWDFVCNQRWMGAVAQSMYMFGVFVGAVTLGNAADKYGRKKIFCISAILQLILGVGVAFTTEYYSFLTMRFLYGIFGSAGSYITGFVLTMELVGPSKRSVCGITFQAAFAGGIMLVAGWGYLIKDRQLLQIIYGLHSLLLCGHWWLMDESPRWLWANGKIKESIDIVQKALKMNGSPIQINEADYVSKGRIKRRTEEEEAGVLDLFKTPNLRKKTLNVCFCWFANSLVYYGLSLSTGKLSGNPFLILFCMGLVEQPSYVITVYLMDRTGRRPLTAFYMIVGSFCCIIAANLTMGSIAATSVVMVGKFMISSSFAIIYNYSAELFPTVIRNSALGIGSMCARTAGTLTPLITLLDSFDPTVPSIIFAIIALISGLLTLFLPETLGSPMPQSIEDGEKFGVGDTFFTSCCRKNKNDQENGISGKPEKEEQLECLNVKKS